MSWCSEGASKCSGREGKREPRKSPWVFGALWWGGSGSGRGGEWCSCLEKTVVVLSGEAESCIPLGKESLDFKWNFSTSV